MPKLLDVLDIAVCPHCGVNSPFMMSETKFATHSQLSNKSLSWRAYSCRKCGMAVLAGSSKDGSEIDFIFPVMKDIDAFIPDEPRDYLQQAQSTIHAPAGSIMLSASAVDSMLKIKGYKTGSLYARIQSAIKNHLMTEDMAKWAHEVRLDANDQRHADENASKPTEADARKVLEFALALAEFLFVLPAKVQRGIAASTNS